MLNRHLKDPFNLSIISRKLVLVKSVLLIGVIALVVSFPSRAQTLTVLDEDTKDPIELVTIFQDESNIHAITNSKGKADITAFKDLKNIEIRSLGYTTLNTSFEAMKTSGFIVYLARTDLNMDEIVVSATRWWQRSGDVPTKIKSITSPRISFYSPQTSADLLGTSGQVFIQKSQQGGGSPMIRGFATNRLLYTVDGVRMNTAIFRAGNIQNVINIDPFSVEKTEIAFSPGSVIYGSDAIGGVMSFQTISPTFSLTDDVFVSGKVVGRFSSANRERTGHFDINLGWKKFSMVTSFSSWNFDDLRQGAHGPDEYIKDYYVQRQDGVDKVITQNDELLQIPTAYSQINLMQKFRYKPGDDWDLNYGFHYSETSDYGRYDRHNRVRNGTARYAEWKYGPQRWIMNNLSITNANRTLISDQITIRLAIQNFDESRIDRSLNSDTRSIRTEKVNAYSLNLDLTKQTGDKNTLFYGFEYILDDVTSTGIDKNIEAGTSAEGPSRYPQAVWQSIAFYINDEYKVTDKITAQAGLRYNQFLIDAEFDTTFYPFPFTTANTNKGAVTANLGAVFRPEKSVLIHSSVGTAFRAPNVDDIGKVFDSEPGAVVIPNPDLKAEYAYNIELGVAKLFGELLKTEITGYYTILDNALVRRDYSLNGQTEIMYDGVLSRVQAIQNAATATVYGFQASVNMQLSKNFSFSTDLNVQKGEEELDDGSKSASRHAAPFFGSSRIGFQDDDLQLLLYVDFQGERSFNDLAVSEQGKDEIYAKDENGNNYAPGWATLNLKAFYELNDQFSVSAGLENITDVRYRPYSSGISGAGRNFFISLRTNI